MALREILTEPNELLRRKSLLVEKVDKDLQKLMDDMLETMYAAPGIGLAAAGHVLDGPAPGHRGRRLLR